MTLTAAPVTAERLEELLADSSIPAVHRALWLLLWEGEHSVAYLLNLDIQDVRLEEFSERAAELLHQLIGDRDTGPLLAVGNRALGWDEAVNAATERGHAIHAFRASGKRHRNDAG